MTAKKKNKNKKHSKPNVRNAGSAQRGRGAAPVEAQPPSMQWFIAGIAALLIAAVASGMLSLQSLGGMALPGCGPESDCAQAAQSFWGTVPGLGWPTSFAGFTYFASLLVAWVMTRGCFAGFIRWIVRLGAAFSLFLTIVMFVEGYLCEYCLVSHLGNFAFLGVMETAGRKVPVRGRPLMAFASMILVVTGGIAIVQGAVQEQVRQRAEEELAGDIERMTRPTDRSTEGVVIDDTPTPDEPPATAVDPAVADPEPERVAGETDDASGASAAEVVAAMGGMTRPVRTGDPTVIDPDPNDRSTWFTGRYRVGPEEAAIRIVAFSSYQCPDCKRIEEQFEQLLEERDDLSFSMMHFPMSSLCNEYMSGANPQPNACWAARAAETAGMLRGVEGFWEMHQWLYSVSGSFTAPELRRQLQSMGYDPDEFIAIMTGPETERRVKNDIELARALGLHYTPMIFINGVELKGWFAPRSVLRAVEAIAADDPEPQTAAVDVPPYAVDKYLSDWRVMSWRRIPEDTQPYILGPSPEEAIVDLVVWGDYQEPFSAELDAKIRAILRGANDVSYHFRHYPINEECNTATPSTKHELACLAHRAAEAAGRLGGNDAYWTMHVWLMENQDDLSRATLRNQIIDMGFEPEPFFAEMDSAVVDAAINEDAAAAKRVGLRSIPFFWINMKRVPRWRLEGVNVPEMLVDLARERQQSGESTAPAN